MEVFSKQRSRRYCNMDALHGRYLNGWRKSLTTTTQECCEQYWRRHPTKQQLYGHLPTITKTGHCWRSRSRNELIRDVLLWTHSHGQARAGRPARTYLQQLCEDTGCSRKRWTIGSGGETGSGISVLMAWQDDDDPIYP